MSLAPQLQSKTISEEGNAAVSFSGKLDSGEVLNGPPAAAEQTTSDLTISNVAINTSILTINNISVPVGEAIQFKVTGGNISNSPYTIVINCNTDSSPSQLKYVTIKLDVVADTE